MRQDILPRHLTGSALPRMLADELAQHGEPEVIEGGFEGFLREYPQFRASTQGGYLSTDLEAPMVRAYLTQEPDTNDAGIVVCNCRDMPSFIERLRCNAVSGWRWVREFGAPGERWYVRLFQFDVMSAGYRSYKTGNLTVAFFVRHVSATVPVGIAVPHHPGGSWIGANEG